MDAKLVMFKSNGQRKDFPLTNPVTSIGRGEECDLRIPLLSVSRRHCELLLADDKLKIKDLASSNGSYVNNKRVTEAEVKAGDRLVVGPVVFTVQIDGVPGDIRPIKTRGQILAEGGAPTEEVVSLEADVMAGAGEDEVVETLEPAGPATEEIDPIAALEAMAGEVEIKKKGQKK